MAAAAGPRARNCWFVWRLFLSGCLPLLRRVLGVCSFFSLFVEMAISKLRAGPTLAWPCPRLNSNSLWGGLCFESHAVRPWIRDPLEDARLITRRRLQISLFFFYSRKQRTRQTKTDEASLAVGQRGVPSLWIISENSNSEILVVVEDRRSRSVYEMIRPVQHRILLYPIEVCKWNDPRYRKMKENLLNCCWNDPSEYQRRSRGTIVKETFIYLSLVDPRSS